ncbi:cysteine hydrolase [Pseudoclavibacter helvolus]|uniref:cysteine hydrolase n=1 Tax=Pseudoclavibacter helvolus TaxID=255205 RepID=UPI003C754FB0
MLTLDPKAALVVVDLQALTVGNAAAVPLAQVRERVAALLARFRAAGSSVAFAISTGTPLGRTAAGAGGRVWPDALLALDDGLVVGTEELLVSRSALSAFSGTDLDAQLRARGVTQLVLVGLATTFGIESTARAAYDLGYNVVVVRDAISDPRPAAHEHSLANVFPALAEVGTTAEVLQALEAGADIENTGPAGQPERGQS